MNDPPPPDQPNHEDSGNGWSHEAELQEARFGQWLAVLVVVGVFAFLGAVFLTGANLNDSVVASMVTLVINNSFNILMLIGYHYWWRGRGAVSSPLLGGGYAANRRGGVDRRRT